MWGTIEFGDDRTYRGTYVIGRLKPRVTIAQAQAELDAVSRRLAERYPVENGGWHGVIVPLKESIVGQVRAPLLLLCLSVSLLLVIAAGNVAILFGARRLRRRREISIQIALGAGRWRLLLHALAECVALVLAARTAGCVVTLWLLRWLETLAPAAIPRLAEVRLSTVDFVVAGTIAALLTVIVWMLSAGAAQLSMDELRSAPNAAGGRPARLLKSVLVRIEIACCTCLLLATIGTVRSFVALERSPLGFDPGHVLAVDVRQPIIKAGEHVTHYPNARFIRIAEAVQADASTLPGVAGASVAYAPPLMRQLRPTTYRVLEHAITGPATDMPAVTGPDTRQSAWRVVGVDFFSVMRTPIVAGRAFSRRDRLSDREMDDWDIDRGVGAAIVSAAFARQFGSIPAALGRYLAISDASYRSVRIVGVAADVVSVPGQLPAPAIYLPYAEDSYDTFTLLVRAGDPAAVAAPIAAYMRSTLGTDVSTITSRTYADVVAQSLAPERFSSEVMSLFGIVAIAFTAVALYSVLAFLVAARKRDLAIRVALGAEPRVLLRGVFGESLSVAAVGLAVGLAAGLLLMRTLRADLPHVESAATLDALLTAALVLSASVLSSYLPARTASRADPLPLLRSD